MQVQDVIVLARKHAGNGAAMESSARLCLAEAVNHYNAGNFGFAMSQAIRSLSYSVGIFHADYRKVVSLKP